MERIPYHLLSHCHNNTYYNSGYTDGYSNSLENVSIKYVYHKHINGENDPSTNIIYSTTDPGGCYVAGGHDHNSSCTTESYTDACGGTVCAYSDSNGNVYDRCPKCEKKWTRGTGPVKCTRQVSKTRYTCGEPTNKWIIGCGKTEESIESVIITFND